MNGTAKIIGNIPFDYKKLFVVESIDHKLNNFIQ